MRASLTLSPLLLTAVLLHADDNWPQFRGPNGDGIASARNLPVHWSEKENVRWKTAIHDKGWSSPVIWRDQIWLTTARADGKEFFAVCVDRKSGRIIQDVKLFADPKPAYCHPYNSYASPTPVIEEGRLYFAFGSHGTGCLDTTTAKVLWLRRDFPCYHHRGPGSSPIIDNKHLFLLFDGYDQQYVAALDKATGKTVWKKDRDIVYSTTDGDIKKAYATPSLLEIKGKLQLVCPAAEATIAYDPANGDEIWRVIHGGMNEATRPAFGNGLIYLTSGHTAQLIAVRQGGSGDLTKTGIAWKANRGVPTRPSPLVVDDRLYMVSDKGVATCLEALTGKQLWTERLGGDFCASPLFADGHIFLCDEEGKTHVLNPSAKYESVALNTLDAGCMASPIAVGDALYLRTKTHLYCIAAQPTK
jgi:outer membrane protein assembly factor BamB